MSASPQSKYSLDASTPASADAEMLLGLSVEQQRQQQKSVGAGGAPPSIDSLVMAGSGGGEMYDGGGGQGMYGNGYGIMIESEDVNMSSMDVNHLLPFLEFIPNFSLYGTDAAVEDVG